MTRKYVHKTFATPEELVEKVNKLDPENPDIETVLFVYRAVKNADDNEEDPKLRKMYSEVYREMCTIVSTYIDDTRNTIKEKYEIHGIKDVEAFDMLKEFVEQLPYDITDDPGDYIESLRRDINLDTESIEVHDEEEDWY